MTVAAYTTLKITDGTITADLVDGSNYALVDGGWAPAVAPLRLNTLGGRGAYEDVPESITVNVLGSTGAICLANLAKLSQLLDQAERFARGEPVNPARLQVQPQGSTLAAPLESVILGRTSNGASLGLPVTFNDTLMAYEIPNVSLAFLRRGLWVGAAETAGPSDADQQMDVTTVTFASSPVVAGPVKVELEILTLSGAGDGYVLFASDPDHIQFIEGEDLDLATHWTAEADIAVAPGHQARGNGFLRYTPVGTGLSYVTGGSMDLPEGTGRVMLFASVRNNSASATYRMQVYLRNAQSLVDYAAPVYAIEPTNNDPQIVYLGMVALPPAETISQLSQIRIDLTASVADASLDIDWVVAVAMIDDTARAIRYQSGIGSQIIVDPGYLSRVSPSVYAYSYDAIHLFYGIPYAGDAFLVVPGDGLSISVLKTAAESWGATGAAQTQKIMLATRWPAYLTPQ